MKKVAGAWSRGRWQLPVVEQELLEAQQRARQELHHEGGKHIGCRTIKDDRRDKAVSCQTKVEMSASRIS
jgi:hypothetical protein